MTNYKPFTQEDISNVHVGISMNMYKEFVYRGELNESPGQRVDAL